MAATRRTDAIACAYASRPRVAYCPIVLGTASADRQLGRALDYAGETCRRSLPGCVQRRRGRNSRATIESPNRNVDVDLCATKWKSALRKAADRMPRDVIRADVNSARWHVDDDTFISSPRAFVFGISDDATRWRVGVVVPAETRPAAGNRELRHARIMPDPAFSVVPIGS